MAAKKSADAGVLRGRNLLYDFAEERLRDYIVGICEFIETHCEGLDVVDLTRGKIGEFLGKGKLLVGA